MNSDFLQHSQQPFFLSKIWSFITILIVVLFIAIPLSKFIIFLLWNGFKYIFKTTDFLQKYTSKDVESWAVVTGGTDGIGLGFCEVLTQLGFNIAIISRNQKKIQETISKLEKFRPQQFKTAKFKSLVFDFKDVANEELFSKIKQKLNDLDIALLVNNVGTSEVNLMQKLSYQQIVDIINVNCTSMAVLTSALLKKLGNRKQKTAIINLSSFLGESPAPYNTLYSATKAFNHSFSNGISMEYPHIDILSLKPMFVESPLSRKKKGFNIPDRRQCAAHTLAELNWQHETHGYLSHRITAYLLRNWVPQWMERFFLRKSIKGVLKKSHPEIFQQE